MSTAAQTMQPISAADAEAELPNVRTFPTPAAYPKRTYAISVTSPAGFPIEISYHDMTLDRLEDALAALLERGYMPAEAPSPNAPAAHSSAPAQAAPAGEAPICPVHTDRRMKVSNYGGWFCTATNIATGEKCKEKVK